MPRLRACPFDKPREYLERRQVPIDYWLAELGRRAALIRGSEGMDFGTTGHPSRGRPAGLVDGFAILAKAALRPRPGVTPLRSPELVALAVLLCVLVVPEWAKARPEWRRGKLAACRHAFLRIARNCGKADK